MVTVSMRTVVSYSLPFLFFFTIFFVIPHTTFAAIVQCDGVAGAGKSCQTCDFVKLGKNILDWIIGIMASVSALVIMYAGFLMVTSGGSTEKVSHATHMITNTVIGFIILLSAWLIVDTFMKLMVGDTLPGFGPWNEIQCVSQPTVTPTPTTPTQPTAGACPIPALSLLTDASAQSMEGGATVVWKSGTSLQTCANRFISKVGGTVTSAYRPPDYQNHLWEINDRWCRQGLRSNTDAACSALKSSVQTEVSKHGLGSCGAVATTNNSTHSTGMGVDISGPAHGTALVQQAAAQSCLIWRNYTNDPVHYDLQPGCTCN